MNFAQKMKEHNDLKEKFTDNADVQNRAIAFDKIFNEVMGKQRKNVPDLYRLTAQDESLKIAMQDILKRMLTSGGGVENSRAST